MTPCQGNCPPPECPQGCPPGQSCYRIAEGYQEGYCTWTVPSPVTISTSCESPSNKCCCDCEEASYAPECSFYITTNDNNTPSECDGARYNCKQLNSATQYNADGPCCTMTEPEETDNFLRICQLTGTLCTPCNRLQKPRATVDPSKPYPYSHFFAPCYKPEPLNFAALDIDPDNMPILSMFWTEIKFLQEGVNPCEAEQKCKGRCVVYSQCSLNPENPPPETFDACQAAPARFGVFCYPLDIPSNPCVYYQQGSGCIPVCSCPYGDPVVVEGQAACDGFGPVPYCEFFCPPPPCDYITCPPGYYCDNNATPNCQPL